jgi:hypothetical protein
MLMDRHDNAADIPHRHALVQLLEIARSARTARICENFH